MPKSFLHPKREARIALPLLPIQPYHNYQKNNKRQIKQHHSYIASKYPNKKDKEHDQRHTPNR